MTSRQAAFFNVGDPVTFGKYQNKPGKIVRFMDDGKGNPVIEVEPVPKGLKKNKIMPLFRIRHRVIPVPNERTARSVATRYVEAGRVARESPAIYEAAVAAYETLPFELQREVDSFLHGVFGGKAQPLEAKADQLYDHYESVRAVIRSKHGSTVTVYRGEPKDKPPIKRRFLSWTPSYKLAAIFAQRRDFEIVVADVRVSDVAAVLVSPHNKSYVEYLVKYRPEYHEKGQSLPLLGAIWADSVTDDGVFSVTRAQIEARKIERAIQGAGGRVLNVKIDEENEMLLVSVELPPTTPLRPNDETTAVIGPYLVEGLQPFAHD